MTAQTTTQRTAKHRLAVKERMARMEMALRKIALSGPFANYHAAQHVRIAREALDPTTTPKTPE